MLSLTEENYIKAIYHLSNGGTQAVTTNDIAMHVQTKAATVTDMVKKLSGKDLVEYEKYYGVHLSKKGKMLALAIVRKHRLWETFLVKKLGFQWDEVHEVAEQLEHIQSSILIEKLDAYLGHPETDPHGHPIPDKKGKVKQIKTIILAQGVAGRAYEITEVKDGSSSFLQFLAKNALYPGSNITIKEVLPFDGSLVILTANKTKISLSKTTAENILVKDNA
ncbi:MAG: metal-dependent transcriptional regulator [Cyclobacteriaceae bacterium]|jgi:DtxR family Mn-dependent transcriptional regulator|nr:metal-dependent transcriptional regulator [Cyclobacteriaceae bacterium]